MNDQRNNQPKITKGLSTFHDVIKVPKLSNDFTSSTSYYWYMYLPEHVRCPPCLRFQAVKLFTIRITEASLAVRE